MSPKNAIRFSLGALTLSLFGLAYYLPTVVGVAGPPEFWRIWFVVAGAACLIATVRPVLGATIPVAGAFAITAFASRAGTDAYSHATLPHWQGGAIAFGLLAVLTWALCFSVARYNGRQ